MSGEPLSHTELIEESLARSAAFFAAMSEEEREYRNNLLAELDALYKRRQQLEDRLRTINREVLERIDL